MLKLHVSMPLQNWPSSQSEWFAQDRAGHGSVLGVGDGLTVGVGEGEPVGVGVTEGDGVLLGRGVGEPEGIGEGPPFGVPHPQTISIPPNASPQAKARNRRLFARSC